MTAQQSNLSASRVRQARQVLSSVLELAVDGGYLSSNPARGLKVSSGPKREMRTEPHRPSSYM